MTRNDQIQPAKFRFANVAFSLVLFGLCFQFAVAVQGQVQGDIARDAFRKFYEPKLPLLNASYQNVRFKTRSKAIHRNMKGVDYSSGAFGQDRYYFEWYPTQWTLNKNERNQDDDDFFDRKPVKVLLQLPDEAYQIRIPTHATESNRLSGTPNKAEFRKIEPAELLNGPIASPWLLMSYQRMLDDKSIVFVDFIDDQNNEFPDKTKRLFFRHANDPVHTLETVFDAKTGVCLQAIGFTSEIEGQRQATLTFEYQMDTQHPDWLPAVKSFELIVFKRTDQSTKTEVIQYERGKKIPESEFTLKHYGIDEPGSRFSKKKLDETVKNISKNTSKILQVALLVLLAMFGLMIILVLSISFLARKRKSGNPDNHPNLDPTNDSN